MSRIQTIVTLLKTEYGTPVRSGQRWTALEELVSTILSQHTSDANTARAFESLRTRFPRWEAIIAAPTADVADAIRSGGLANQKAPRIQAVLSEVKYRRGCLDLDFLREMPIPDALEWLTSLHGVGPKTAACVLLFALERPVMPVDTHVHRVGLRLGLLQAGTSADRAHGALEGAMNADEIYETHMLLIQHGRQTCKARVPRCGSCVLRHLCPSAALFLKRKENHDNG